MKFEVRYGPAYALGVVELGPGEKLQAVTGAMVSMSDTITMQTKAMGGIMAGLKRSVLGGESFFINTFSADAGGEITVASCLPGDIVTVELTGQTVFVQSGSFLAASDGVTLDTKWGGAKTFFSGEGLFLLKCGGTGTMLVSAYGAMEGRTLAAGERYTIDSSHIVTFDESVKYEVGRSGGWKSTILGGEGLVVKLTGPGDFHMQTRSPQSLLDWLIPQLPTKSE